ncbi:MAG: hypothetical protein QM657_06075 [Lacrimispora sp.]|uniref:hypothetical protein n=1 Tax=Lacrimispora sp. TaxID=2719234 RepID=UPI0039E22A45
MRSRLIIDGNAVYEIDEECLKRKQNKKPDTRGGNGQGSLARQGVDKGQSR